MKKINFRLKDLLILILLIVAFAGFLLAVAELPAYGQADNPVHNQVARRYINEAKEDTGIFNMVTAIVLDYRAYDTMYETIVLFTATLAVVLTLKTAGKQDEKK